MIQITNGETKAYVQRYRVLKNKGSIFSNVLSWSFKLLPFLTLHRHHKMHKALSLTQQHLRVLLTVHHIAYKSTTLQGKTQHSPNLPKNVRHKQPHNGE